MGRRSEPPESASSIRAAPGTRGDRCQNQTRSRLPWLILPRVTDRAPLWRVPHPHASPLGWGAKKLFLGARPVRRPTLALSCRKPVRRHGISVNFRLGGAFRAWGGLSADLHGGFPPVRTTTTNLDIKHWASVLASASGLPAFRPRGTCTPADIFLPRKSLKNRGGSWGGLQGPVRSREVGSGARNRRE